MKIIKLKFVDFWQDFQTTNNFIFNLLKDVYQIEFSDNPDYIIYSSFGYEHLKYSDAIRIFYSGENQVADFNICDYAIGFQFISYEDRYMRLPLFYLYNKDFDRALNKHLIGNDDLVNKLNFCNFIYSNSNADPKREEFFHLLSRYKKVDSGGRFLNNIGGRVEDKFIFQSKYKFSIAFENSTNNGYTTEKILQAFSSKTIPIYWGNKLIEKDFNANSFINCHNYKDFEEVIERIKEIDNNNDLYLKMLKSPILNDYMYDDKQYTSQLKEFLYPIFDIDIMKAFRRNRIYWGKKYEENMKNKMMSIDTKALSYFERLFSFFKK